MNNDVIKFCQKCKERIFLDIDKCPICGGELTEAKRIKREERASRRMVKEMKTEIEESIKESFEKGELKPTRYDVRVYPSFLDKHFKMVNLDQDQKLNVIDRIIKDDFGISLAGRAWYKTHYCETLEEFIYPFISDIELSETLKKEIIENQKAVTIDDVKRGLVTLGVNFPGKGCYINGWAFSKLYDCRNAKEALYNQDVYPEIVGTVTHEKLGHGFIDAFTKAGEETIKLKSAQYYLAEHFNLKTMDTPDDALLGEKWGIVFDSMKYTQEGYAMWVQNYVLSRLGEIDSEKDYSSHLSDYDYQNVMDVLDSIASKNPSTSDVIDNFKYIYETEVIDEKRIHNAVVGLQEDEDKIEEDFTSSIGRPPRYVLGYLLMKKIEERLGTKCVPYSIIIAGNLQYNLDKISNTDLARMVHTEPKLNIDTRLALISCLPGEEKNNIKHLSNMAKEYLNMVIPKELI